MRTLCALWIVLLMTMPAARAAAAGRSHPVAAANPDGGQSLNQSVTRWFVAVDGDDAAGGSIDDPLATIEQASHRAAPGDTIYLRGGTYGGIRHRYNGRSGTADQPVVVTPFQNETVILDGTGVPVSSSEALFSISNWDEILSHLIVDGVTVRNSSGRGLTYYNVSDVTIRNCTVHAVQYKAIGGYGHYLTIENNTAYAAALINQGGVMQGGGWPGVIQPNSNYVNGAPSTHIVISGNTVHDCWGEGILVGNSHQVMVANNTVHNVFSVLIYLDKATDVIVRDNYLYITTDLYNRQDKGYPANAISMANEAPIDPGELPVANIQIYNNLMVGCGRGVSYWQDSANSSSENRYAHISVFHNVIRTPVHQAIWFDEVPAGYTAPDGCQLRNNIIEPGSQESAIDNPGAWGISHNNWVSAIPAFAVEANSFASDPQFVAPVLAGPVEGYRLQSGSICLDAGIITTPGVDADIMGRPRDEGRPDLGVFEHEIPGVLLQVRLFLQGAFAADQGRMRSSLMSGAWVPHTSPYPEAALVVSRFPDDSLEVVDWVLLELVREDGVSVAAQKSLFLRRDGWLLSTRGAGVVKVPGVSDGNYYIGIRHRNHIAVRSAQALALNTTGAAACDFSSGAVQYAGSQGCVEVAQDVWGLVAGEGVGDGHLTSRDYVVWHNAAFSGAGGYEAADFNLDGLIDPLDYALWLGNARAGYGAAY